MAKGAEQGRAVVSARKDRISTKKQKEKADTESSSDSDVERAAEDCSTQILGNDCGEYYLRCSFQSPPPVSRLVLQGARIGQLNQ